mgnify:CR=1 FL=1
MRIERDHLFDVPLEAGFEYVTDPANWPSYWPGIVGVEPGGQGLDPLVGFAQPAESESPDGNQQQQDDGQGRQHQDP